MLGLDVCKNKQYLIDDLENTFFVFHCVLDLLKKTSLVLLELNLSNESSDHFPISSKVMI